MSFVLPKLNYKFEELEPILSKETLEYHYGKHHQAYINNLNNLIVGSEDKDSSLENIILKAEPGAIFNNAAQIYNHNFYWQCLTPVKKQGVQINYNIIQLINNTFGNIESFKEKFNEKAAKHFGSGWVWLVLNGDKKLEIIDTHDADTPVKKGFTPLLTIDVWEHAYYIDYRNNRIEYLNKIWQIINWDFVEKQYIECIE